VRRTISSGGGFVVEMVAHDGCSLVKELGDFGVGLVLKAFIEKIDIVATASFDQDFLDGSTLVKQKL